MLSITSWLLCASFHQEAVPSQVTAAGSCAQVTLPGTTPQGTPMGESVGSKSEERKVVAAAIDRVNCRRIIPILIPHAKALRLLQLIFREHKIGDRSRRLRPKSPGEIVP